MCRLLGYQGKHPRMLKREILEEPNAILRQSVCDRDVCKPKDDGWGFGFEDAGRLTVVKRPAKPAGDEMFFKMAEVPYRRLLVHIRRASVGGRSMENTHPWQFGPDLVFAHNGSVYGFDDIRGEALDTLAPSLRERITGRTDSEFAMFTFLRNVGDELNSKDIGPLHAALQRTVAELRLWSDKAGADRLPKLNFMILTRHFLLATRVIHSLGYYVTDDGVLITSESLRDGDGWTSLDDDRLIAVKPDGAWETRSL